MPPGQRAYNHAARKRTATLPKSIRQELEQLGQLEPQNQAKSRLGRKDRRKAERNQPKQNRAQHQGGPTPTAAGANKKRTAADALERERAPVASTSTATTGAEVQQPAKKRAKTTGDEVETAIASTAATTRAEAPAAPKMTALEKRLAKQERGVGPDPARKRSKGETDDDKEIAWLEAKLGLPRGLTKAEKGKMKAEYDEDGLGGESIKLVSGLSGADCVDDRCQQTSLKGSTISRAPHSGRARRCALNISRSSVRSIPLTAPTRLRAELHRSAARNGPGRSSVRL